MDSDLRSTIDSALNADIQHVSHIGGGSINQSYRVETKSGKVFVKANKDAPKEFFVAEIAGLQALRQASVIRVPEVIANGITDGGTNYLVLEWIPAGKRTRETSERLGRQLAQLHQTTAEAYGWAEDNYIGELPQYNRWEDSWVTFYASQRLATQTEIAAKRGYLTRKRGQQLHHLQTNLGTLINETHLTPALLHGDLWGGNWMVDEKSNPVLIDPAIYYGNREVDLAMSRLFGGFSQTFYDAYAEVYPLPAGYVERSDIYQLYYLLVHLNLFGEGYGSKVDSILQRYVG